MLLQGTLFQEDLCLRDQLLKTSRKSWLSHRHTYSWTYSLWSGAQHTEASKSSEHFSCLLPWPLCSCCSEKAQLICFLPLDPPKTFSPSKKFRFKCFFFSLSLSFELLTIRISPSLPESCRHCTSPLKWGWLWFLPSSITQVKGIHIILTGGMKDRNWKNQVANENMTQRMVYFQPCTDQHLFQFKYRRGRRGVYK